MRRLLELLRAAPPLPRYLLGALALRLPAVLWSRGYEFVDQQFQYIDPAYGLAFDADWQRTWEWQLGMRSWAYPGLLAGGMRLLASLGVTDPNTMMACLRLGHAVVSLLPLCALWLLLVRWRPVKNAGLVLWLAAGNGLLVYAGVQPSGPTFALGLSLAAIFLFEGPKLWPLLAGLCLGLAFACRFQDAFFGPALFVTGLVQRRPRAALLLCAGCVPPVLAQGWLDLQTWGTFLHSPFAYVHANFFGDRAAGFGRTPLYQFLGFVAAFLLPVVPAAWRALVRGARLLPGPSACALFYLLIHAIPARRQLRFVLPAIALLLLVLAVGLVQAPARDALSRGYRRVMVGAHALLFVLASCWYFHRGPIEAALRLRAEPQFKERLWLVGTGFEVAGGYYYLGRKRMQLEPVPADELARRLGEHAGPWPLYLMVKPTPLTTLMPLADQQRVTGHELELIAATSDRPDWKRSNRRFIYRVQPAGNVDTTSQKWNTTSQKWNTTTQKRK